MTETETPRLSYLGKIRRESAALEIARLQEGLSGLPKDPATWTAENMFHVRFLMTQAADACLLAGYTS